MLPFADGTDQMGSCRAPAAFANIYGFRPTTGLIASDRTFQDPKIPVLITPGVLQNTRRHVIAFRSNCRSNNNDPLSFDLDNKFEFSNLTDKEFSKIKLVLLEDVIEKYPFEKV